MCGIAGIFQASYSQADLQTQVRRMTTSLAHRGPDSDGILVRADLGLAFGHRRLAIQDLSEAGAQPMASASGRFTMVYNGEIYNAEELRAKLTGNIQWRGHSDTEVLLCAFEQLGIVATIRLAVGTVCHRALRWGDPEALSDSGSIRRKAALLRDASGRAGLRIRNERFARVAGPAEACL